jgi:hypothetical protein
VKAMNFDPQDDGRTVGSNEAPGEVHHLPGEEELLLKATSAIELADKAVLACEETVAAVFEQASDEVHDLLGKALVTIYTAVSRIEHSGGGAQFLADRGVKVHGNVKNPYQPYLRAFTKKAHPWVRGKICKCAAVIGLARHENVSADEIGAWLKTHPVEMACSEYRRIMRARSNAQPNDQMHRANAIIVDRKKEPEMAPLLPATPITPHYAGIKLAIVDFADDGSGDYYLLGILAHNEKAIWRMVLSASSKAATPPVQRKRLDQAVSADRGVRSPE